MPSTMLAAVFRGPGELKLEQMPVPKVAGADEVLLKVLGASICGTDLHILADPPGHPATLGTILGHEYVAEVVEAGTDVHHVRPGDHVVIDANLYCGTCDYCLMGRRNLCTNMSTLGIFRHGGFAAYNVAPAANVYPISRDTPLEQAIFAEPLSCVMNAVEQAHVVPGDSVAIFGAGPIGLLFQLLMKTSGAGKVVMVEPSAPRREVAKKMGANAVIDPTVQDPGAAIRETTRIGADIVIDAVGSQLAPCIDSARRGGRVILFGSNSNAKPPIQQYWITRHELTICGSYISRHTFPQVVKLLESGRLPLPQLITHDIGLSRIGEGLAALKKGDAIEVILRPE